MKIEDISKEFNNLTTKDLEFIDYFCIRNQIREGQGFKIIFAKLISDYKKIKKLSP